jgi:hypothetical protein
MLRPFIFLIVFFPAIFANAGDTAPAIIQQAFQEQASLNMIGYCPDNVFHFLKKIEAIDRNEVQYFSVLIIYSTSGSIFPMQNRRQGPALDIFGEDREWLYHVVALHKNHVFDFEYTGKELPTLADYLQKMFLDNKSRHQSADIKVMTVPATDYLQLDPYFAGVEIKNWIKENTYPTINAVKLQP